MSDPITAAISRLHAHEKSNPGMTPKEKADFIKRELEKAVPAKEAGMSQYSQSKTVGFNECRKQMGLE